MESIVNKHKKMNNGQMLKEWDENCEKKSPAFLEARLKGDFERCFSEFTKNAEIEIDDTRFVYFFDNDFSFLTSIQNITPNYSLILKDGFKALLYTSEECTNTYTQHNNSVVMDIREFLYRIIIELTNKGMSKQAEWFKDMWDRPATHFEEGIQRILFVNQLIWQTGSRLVGLGRLDYELFYLYENDFNNGIITKDDARCMIKDFLHTLHKDYWFKSNVLLGDTGQVIIVGGVNKEQQYMANDLTFLFIEEVANANTSDPKIVLRTSRKMPHSLMEAAVKCMSTGCGSPLLSNDDVLIPKLINFGVEEADAYSYTTSACWEPLIGGKSSSMNNQRLLVYPRALHNLLLEVNCDRFKQFDDFIDGYFLYLRREVVKCLKDIYEQKVLRNTVYSMFIEGCHKSQKDIIDGGAVYHNVGMTVAGLGNTINSLLNIKTYVFEQKKYSFEEVKKICVLDYEGADDIASELSSLSYFATDDEQAIALTNRLQCFVSELTMNFRTPIGGKLKFGASSPSHIMAGEETMATFDGRRNKESLIVHISNESAESYTSVINFAAGLDYADNRFNGNVVDFVVSPMFMERNFDKFVTLLFRATEVGYFQLQINVVRSDVLIEAKKHPEVHQGLIVRVWGFSAYFVELPESYQNLLIERALRAERRYA